MIGLPFPLRIRWGVACSCWLAIIAAVALPAVARAAVYDVEVGDAQQRALRLHVPEGVPVVHGIIIVGNGAGEDARDAVYFPELVALATTLRFAVLGAAHWTMFPIGLVPDELKTFEDSLADLAAISGHAELVHAPWVPIGHSNGGQMSFGLNALRPEKVIAVVVSKGAYYNTARPVDPALQTPGLLVAGELDSAARVTAIHDLFFGNRPRGALWAWVEEEGTGHEVGDATEMVLPFVEAMVRKRYPPGVSPLTGPVPLLPLDEADGWLTDPDTYKTGLAVIAPRAAYVGDPSRAGWLPDRRSAYIFRAYASYQKGAATATVDTALGVVAVGEPVTYTISTPLAPWAAIEYFEGDVRLKRVESGDRDPLSVTYTPATAGYAVLHALITFADGAQRTTLPRRVFAWAEPPPPLAAPVLTGSAAARAGDEVVLRAGVTGVPEPEIQWTRDGIDLPGATTAEYRLPVAQRYDAGSYRVRLTRGFEVVTSEPFVLTVGAPPASTARLLNLSTRGLCLTGENILVTGFVIGGVGTKELLVRVVGPRLQDFGVLGSLSDPTMALQRREGNAWVDEGSNDDWWTSPDREAIIATQLRVGAFPLNDPGADSTLLAALSAGSYTAVNSGVAGGTGVALVELYDADVTAGPARLVNLSTRGYVGVEGDILIAGFVISTGEPKTLLVRVVGPALATYGVSNFLPDPQLTIYRRLPGPPEVNESIARNDAWGDNGNAAEIVATSHRLNAFPLPAGSADAALIVTLPPGTYTVHAAGTGAATGVALVEIYEADE